MLLHCGLLEQSWPLLLTVAPPTTHYSRLPLYLLEQPALEHLAAARVDALAQRHAWRGEEEGAHVKRGAEGVELLVVGSRVVSSTSCGGERQWGSTLLLGSRRSELVR